MLREMIERARRALADKLAARQQHTDELARLRAAVEAGDTTVTDEQVRAAVDARTALDAEIDQLDARVRELTAELERDEATARLQREISPSGAPQDRRPAYDQVARVGAEARTYRPDTDPKGVQFLRDLGSTFLYPHSTGPARDRIEQHDREGRVDFAVYMDRAAGTGAFAGLTVPQYLTDLYAPAAAAGRGLADALTKLDLPPDGMTVNLSRITTATSVALQATENTAVSETNIDDTLLTINVQTSSGQQTLSRQAIDRGTGTEQVVMNDLFRRYHANLDSTLINQAATGLTNVATAITYTDATPTVAELYPKFAQANSAVEAALLDQCTGSDNVIAVMHSRRWYWLQNAIGTSWPLMQQPGIGFNSAMVNFAETYGRGYRGMLPNSTPVVVDNNISTALGAGTEDEIYVLDRGQAFLWEDPGAPVFIRAEQPAAASLGVLFVVWGYYAYTFQRFAQAQKINGTGLIAPAFTGV